MPFFKETIKIFETNMKPRIWLTITGKTWRSESNHTIFYLHRTIIQRLYIYRAIDLSIDITAFVFMCVSINITACIFIYAYVHMYLHKHTHIISQKGKLYKRDLQSYAFLVYFKICFLRWRKEFKHYIYICIYT